MFELKFFKLDLAMRRVCKNQCRSAYKVRSTYKHVLKELTIQYSDPFINVLYQYYNKSIANLLSCNCF